ncbi:hypothetical protein SH2C18_34140 [Clostridium sediminicola]|uniref:acyl-CoA dehydratase activase-related protein n=1 Tax=Clostridium sediminicola TaxID=3114879 RepID=UPI0031F2290A
MKVGVQKGLFYYKYRVFIQEFLNDLGAEVILSQDTNKRILDLGIKYCVDDACVPIKIFTGHVESIKEECDLIVIPRIMSIRDKEFICPKFCGLPEIISNSLTGLPQITSMPLYINNKTKLFYWCKNLGKMIGAKNKEIKIAFHKAMKRQIAFTCGYNDKANTREHY